MSMTVGFIGAGSVARSVARRAIAAGHKALLSSASGRTAAALAAEVGGNARAVAVSETAAAELIVLATRWPQVGAALSAFGDWSGRVLVDATNHFASVEPLVLEDLGGRSSSVLVRQQAPGARVVKAFNSLPIVHMDRETERAGAKRVLFLSGDDQAAKSRVTSLIESMGLATLDLGSLQDGGLMQQAGGPLAGPQLFLAR